MNPLFCQLSYIPLVGMIHHRDFVFRYLLIGYETSQNSSDQLKYNTEMSFAMSLENVSSSTGSHCFKKVWPLVLNDFEENLIRKFNI